MEHLKMRLSHEAINPDIIDMELIELKFIFDRSAPIVPRQRLRLTLYSPS